VHDIIRMAGISLAVSAISTACGLWVVQGELETRPPIAIVDYGPLADAVNAGVDADVLRPYLAEFKRRAGAYEDAGFVVINAASVDAAPSEVFVPPPDDLPTDWTSNKQDASPDLAGAAMDRAGRWSTREATP